MNNRERWKSRLQHFLYGELTPWSLAVLLALLLTLGWLTGPAEGGEAQIAGRAVVLDGDTLLVDGVKVRLWGIDAPEMSDWPWGAWARGSLDVLASGVEVRCDRVATDRHKRPVAICGVEGYDDLARYMLRGGWAVVYRSYTGEAEGALAARAASYNTAELMARQNKAGIWRGY